MRYLFFDIESSNGYDGVCEFGFVLTDTSFNILLKKVYLINPRRPFNTVGRKNKKDMVLYFDEEDYLKSPDFPDIYDNIKFLIEQKDLMIFGHAVSNDINFLRMACNRYKKPHLNFEAYDVQKMVWYFKKNRKRFTSLEEFVNEYIPDGMYRNLIEHKSDDDAESTMLELKAMLDDLEFTVNDLIEVSKGCKINSLEYIKRLEDKYEDMKLHPEKYTKDGRRRNPGQYLWGEYYRSEERNLNNEETIFNIYTVSGNVKKDVNLIKPVIEEIKRRGGIPYDRINGADFIIVKDDSDIERLKRIFEHPYNGTFIKVDDFIHKN